MSKPIIAVDIDEVLSPLHDLMFAHHNQVYGTNYPLRDPSGNYYLQQYSDETDEEMARRIKLYILSPAFQLAVKPLAGAVRAIEQLKQRYDLVIVTSRQDFYYDFTHAWLAEHFPKAFDHVVFTEYRGKAGVKVPKSSICKELGASYIIEDMPSHAFECAEAGMQVVLFGDYPWNQAAELPDGVTRCNDWQAVLEYFDDLEDIAEAERRKHESTRPFEQLVDELKGDGLL